MGRALARSADRQWRERGKAKEIAAPEGEKATQAGREEKAASDRAERPKDTLIHILARTTPERLDTAQGATHGKA